MELKDFVWTKWDDGTLVVEMADPIPVGGLSIEFKTQRRFGDDFASGYVTKSMASGFYGVSGMNIVNSGEGKFNVAIAGVDTSGMDCGEYAFKIARTDSGSRTSYTEGYMSLQP